MISETMSPIASVPAPEWTTANKEAGRVDALLPDGGRALVGGNMLHPKKYAFAARSDGTVGTMDPSAIFGRVYDIAAAPNRGFYFAGAGGVSFLKRATWTPVRAGRYRSVATDGGLVYLGAETGQVESVGNWAVRTMGSARALEVCGSALGYVFVANAGSSIGAITKLRVEDGVQMPWASSPGVPVLDIALSADKKTLYAAIGGPGGTAAAYDTATGERRWFHMTDGNCQAICVLEDGTIIVGMHGDYVAGVVNKKIAEFGSGGRVSRKKIFALDPGGNLLDWKVSLTSTESPLGVWALAADSTKLYVGGDFTHVNGVSHPRLAAFAIMPATT